MSSPIRRAPRRLAALAAGLVVGALALTGCSSSDDDQPASTATGAASDAFPVTIDGALGSATIDKQPERVVTWGWSAQDAVLALGVVPVAMPKYTYGGDANGVLPWDADQITKLGAQTPTLLTGQDTNEIPFQQIVAAKPDVILAPYSGITQDDYDKLSKIAPTVAYPEKPWATTWQDQTTIIGKALGKSAEAEKLVEQTNAHVADLAAKYPVLKGKSFVYGSNNDPGQLNVYRASDPRVQLLNQLGLVNSPSVTDLDPNPDDGSYFFQVSYENVSKIETDLLVAYFDDQAAADTFASDPLIAAMPSVKSGAFAPIVGQSFVMASSAPTVLSMPWMLDQYVPQLAAAAEKVK
ncbi:iron-siderophore ABC transporter substrate-binding protein [Luteimicrobium subarcticum]|uniref:Iron complex transport system substrate-binding protein n=1 Tax=Luteimicrobium subarcticum TaxID=620910 RepID=A0A2M8WQX4_9MICO|nr:iron-siderophore ABC transporter substrate-binding protein [Luteimicrobium subarcticum]PJI93294.1 iron complex transport system substrate-binding protein [Luteimicrobium subarcticum]